MRTSCHPIAACGSLGTAEGRASFFALAATLGPSLRYIGIGLTEAGLVHNSPSIGHLAEFLHRRFASCDSSGGAQPLSVLNTDNVPWNGDAIKSLVSSCEFTQAASAPGFAAWLRTHVHFHNSMVDRITSHRAGDKEVPRAEPLPSKAVPTPPHIACG